MKYRKNPIVIEALLWNGKNLREIINFTGLHESARKFSLQESDNWEIYENLVEREGLKIFTLEGPMMASVGDYIIKGIKGEVYPCKPDIFAASYSPASDPTPSSAEVYRKALEVIRDKARKMLPERFPAEDGQLASIYTILHTAREALSHSSQPEQVKGEDWISVDKPPKKRIRVIGWPDVGGYDIVHVDLDGQWKTDDGVPVKYPIIKWQPLPKQPSDHPGLDHMGAEQI